MKWYEDMLVIRISDFESFDEEWLMEGFDWDYVERKLNVV